MKAQELRIGNYVTILREPQKVAEILKNNIISFAPFRECPWTQHPIELIKPILITEEWLVKFGFENDGDTRDLLFNYLICFERIDGKLYISNTETKELLLIEWVHEYQNIFYDLITKLTGEELEITQ